MSPGLSCPGKKASRLCDLINPAHPAYRLGYERAILAATMPQADRIIAQVEAAMTAAPRKGGCCGGQSNF